MIKEKPPGRWTTRWLTYLVVFEGSDLLLDFLQGQALEVGDFLLLLELFQELALGTRSDKHPIPCPCQRLHKIMCHWPTALGSAAELFV